MKYPDPRLRFDPESHGLKEFQRSFFRKETSAVARQLIGAWIARRYDGAWYGARIVETEAYLGIGDAAAHSRGGRRTPRVEPMYTDGGHLYVFLVYGMHHCLNIVTGIEGVPEAVLLRGAEAAQRAPVKLLSGPGRLAAALGITVSFSGIDMFPDGEIRVFRGISDKTGIEIGVSPRIGVDYAGEAAMWPLRFFDKNSSAVSGPALLNTQLNK